MGDTRPSDRDLVEQIDSLHADVSARQRKLLRYVAEFDRRGRWRDDGCRDMAQWLSGRLGITNWAARRWVAAGYALENLPLISDALSSGVLCLDKVLELSRWATPETEKKLITWAKRVSAAAIRHKADRANAPSLEEVQEVERIRSLRWWWFDEGRRMGLEGDFPAAQGAAIAKAIKRVADKLPELPQEDMFPGFEHSAEDRLESRCADALFLLASQTITQDSDADRATVVVHTALGMAEGAGRWSEIEGGPVINPEVARRLFCDARLQFVLTDDDGNALGIGRAARDVPPWLMRELRFRDHGCTFPGCDMRAFLQAHHVRHWEDGGPTDLGNLVLTCHFHHKLVHEFRWNVTLEGSTVKWYRPNGKHYDPGPDPPVQLSAEQLSIDRRLDVPGTLDEEGLAVAV